MRILIIEDDSDTREFIQKRLEEKCFVVDSAKEGNSGMKKIRDNIYDIILLDYALPNKNGFEIIREIRSLENITKRNTPIVMISITHELLNKVTALEYGADDYISKPFFFAELLARIQAILRRPLLQTSSVVTVGDITLDSYKQQISHNGIPLSLTRKEFTLLEYFIKNPNIIISRNSLSEHVWNTDINPFSNTIEMHIVNLRKKLSLAGSNQNIKSISGRGYVIKNDNFK